MNFNACWRDLVYESSLALRFVFFFPDDFVFFDLCYFSRVVGNHRDRFCALYFLRCAVAGNRRTLCVLSCRYCVAGNHHTNFSSNLNLYSCDRSIESPFCLANPPLTLFISFVCVIGNILVHRPGNRHSVLRPLHTSLFIRKIPGELV